MTTQQSKISWFRITVEGVVIVGSILLAFGIDAWWAGVEDRHLELRYLERLTEDLQVDITEINEVINRTDRRLQQIQLLESAIGNPSVAGEDPENFVYALEQVTWRSFPPITTLTYDELVSTGRMALVKNEALRSQIAGYYWYIDDFRRLGLGEDDQVRFMEETLGVLSGSHLSGVEDGERYPLQVSSAEGIELARDFAGRADAHPWLNRLTKYQVLMRRMSEDFLNRAVTLIEEIEEEVDGTR